MEGGRWCCNQNVIAESLPKILYDQVPIVSFFYAYLLGYKSYCILKFNIQLLCSHLFIKDGNWEGFIYHIFSLCVVCP